MLVMARQEMIASESVRMSIPAFSVPGAVKRPGSEIPYATDLLLEATTTNQRTSNPITSSYLQSFSIEPSKKSIR